MRTYTDEQLMAYADGELPAAEVQAIAAAAAADPELAQRIERFAATRRVLHDAFAPTLEEPVPARLLEALASPERKVVPLRRITPASWVPMALAASIALAVGLSVSLWLPQAGPAVAGLPQDMAALGEVLETRASGEPQPVTQGGRSYEILPTATLRAAAGWCREFQSTLEGEHPARARGVACRQPDGQWQLVAVAAAGGAAAAAGEYVPAGAGEPDLAAGLGASERLTPAQEAGLIRDNWRQAPR